METTKSVEDKRHELSVALVREVLIFDALLVGCMVFSGIGVVAILMEIGWSKSVNATCVNDEVVISKTKQGIRSLLRVRVFEEGWLEVALNAE